MTASHTMGKTGSDLRKDHCTDCAHNENEQEVIKLGFDIKQEDAEMTCEDEAADTAVHPLAKSDQASGEKGDQICEKCSAENLSPSSNQSMNSGGCTCCLIQKRRPPDPTTSKDTPEKLYAHMVLISVSFFFMFCAYNGLESLQSSLNVNIGQASVGVIYAFMILCSLTIAPVCVGRWKPKICICISWLCYVSFTLANMYPVWWTMFSSALLLGFGASLVWIAQGVYLTSLAQKYSQLTGQTYQAVLSKFNGIFFSTQASTMIFGNLVSSLLFHHSKQRETNASLEFFSTLEPNVSEVLEDSQVCGAQNCPYLQSHRVYSRPPDAALVQMLLYIFLTCNIIGLITACFLENVDTESPAMGAAQVKSRIKEVFLLAVNPNLLLLIVPLISIRFFQAMSISAYNQAFVTCSLGIGMVGYVMISRATCYTIASHISGKTGQSFHRATHFAVAMVLYITVALMWLLWTPNKDHMWMFFLIPSLEGIGSGIWRVQVSVILGWLFKDEKEAAFAHHNAWLGLGSCIVFSSGNFFCFSTKTFFILTVIGLSIVSYSGLEVKLKRSQTSKQESEC